MGAREHLGGFSKKGVLSFFGLSNYSGITGVLLEEDLGHVLRKRLYFIQKYLQAQSLQPLNVNNEASLQNLASMDNRHNSKQQLKWGFPKIGGYPLERVPIVRSIVY